MLENTRKVGSRNKKFIGKYGKMDQPRIKSIY